MSTVEYPAWSRDWSAPSAQDCPTEPFPVIKLAQPAFDINDKIIFAIGILAMLALAVAMVWAGWAAARDGQSAFSLLIAQVR